MTREKLDRILALIQGSHQKALVMYSNLDLQTQEAYEMAVSGVIRPMNKSPMLITGIRCLQFAPQNSSWRCSACMRHRSSCGGWYMKLAWS